MAMELDGELRMADERSTSSEPTEAEATLLLARILSGRDAGARKRDAKRALDALLEHRLGASARAERFDLLLEREIEGGRVRTEGRSTLLLTADGRRRAQDALGLAEQRGAPAWKTLRNGVLVARALAVRAPSSESLRRLASADGLRATVLRLAHGLHELAEVPTLPQARDALLWKHLGSLLGRPLDDEMGRPFGRGAVVGALLGSLLGETKRGEPARALRLLAARAVGARRPDAEEIRTAILRRWLEGAPALGGSDLRSPREVAARPGAGRGGPTGGSETETTARAELDTSTHAPWETPEQGRETAARVRDEDGDGRGDGAGDIEAFAERVIDLARTSERGRFGQSKVFIAELWRRWKDEIGGPPWDEKSFKELLLEANRRRLLDLSRADLVEAMDPTLVRESETRFLDASFHFVRIPGERA